MSSGQTDSDNIKQKAEVKGPPEERGLQNVSFFLSLPILHGINAQDSFIHARERWATDGWRN